MRFELKSITRLVNAGALALAAAVATIPAQAVEDRPAVDRETLVVAVEKEFQNLDALVTASGDSLRFGWQIYDTLYGFDLDGNLVPRLRSEERRVGKECR